MNPKLLFLTPVRYPTEKAYGVTTGNTIKALKNLNFEIEIWNQENSGHDEFGNTLIRVQKRNSLNRRLLYKFNFLKINQFIFYFDQLRFSVRSTRMIKRNSEEVLLWSRFPLVLFLNCFNKQVRAITVELHHQPKLSSKILLRTMAILKPVEIAMISKSAIDKLQHSGIKIPAFAAEMAVPDSFLTNIDIPLRFPLKICYLGKGKSSGNDNNIQFLLDSFLRNTKLKNLSLEIVGLETESVEELERYFGERLSTSKNITFIPHLRHDQVSNYLDSVSIGLLPYEMNSYNAERFPIKIVEYASKGLWILAASNFARNLKTPPGVLFTYNSNDIYDFSKKLITLADAVTMSGIRNSDAIHFAEKHTYAGRASKFADAFSRLTAEMKF